ncbi:hypothetical protein GCM10018793_67580 [Streptomyces sulfonofaciens]|uniref:Dihydrodipicolinate synthase family protein n=1 Tax=Streptomyces sulfonofaciens TaxID=68272 RepID=A0A919GQF2_9ACTN|nr:DUF993 family protein [Streptomyces sulfonofaciens]GHH88323.1 hypothetical protein GCM10018793_67580 [Streptomyces sulfonofaciens]
MTAKTSTGLVLPKADGGTVQHVMHEPVDYPRHPAPFTSRTVLAAAHVVADARAEYTPGEAPPVDWEATIAFRQHLFSYGIGIAEGMDTSERGPGGLTWPQAQELIRLGVAAALDAGAAVVAGAGTDQLTAPRPELPQIVDAYTEQLEFVQAQGSAAVIRASHALVSAARSEDDYLSVYRDVLAKTDKPAIVHWLGTGFDPTLHGYWGHTDPLAAMDVVVRMAQENADRIDGIKFSLLDEELEKEFRRRLPTGVKVFTGDDYGYTDLLLGDGEHHSHGLLGVLDPIAPIASAGFTALDAGDEQGFVTTMNRSIPMAVKMFEAPADRYKVGTVFIAWLSGHQDHFRMVSGREGMRSLQHLADLFVLTDELGLFPDPDLAVLRMRTLLATAGIE